MIRQVAIKPLSFLIRAHHPFLSVYKKGWWAGSLLKVICKIKVDRKSQRLRLICDPKIAALICDPTSGDQTTLSY
ncbi:MAG: hypothetical protein ACK50H_00530, partial [Dolichospermum sp.]